MTRKLIAGNWKMNGSLAANQALITDLMSGLGQYAPACDVLVCPPTIYLAQVQRLLAGQKAIDLGAQDVSAQPSGAYTGDVSAAMLVELGVRYAIVGHSERRQYQGESDDLVAHKAARLLDKGITPIVCVGESAAERDGDQTAQVVAQQLAAVIEANGDRLTDLVVAYEPIWAIGTGRTATPEQAQTVHALLRAQLVAADPAASTVRLLYGGSMNPGNAGDLLAQNDIDGGLIGGAALKADDFLQIIRAAG